MKKLNKILDIKIIRDRQNRVFKMNQFHYFTDVFNRFHMSIDTHKPTELSLNKYDALRSVGSNDERINQKNYQHAIGSIMYAAIHTRSNIVYVVEKFSQYLSDFAKHHEHALKHFLSYIRSIINKKITYKSSESQKLVDFSNSDYAADKLNRKFILAYVYMIADDSIS